jgi:hypothetical protein
VTLVISPPSRAVALDDSWLDAAFAATRKARVRHAVAADGRGRAIVFEGADLHQLRWMLRVHGPGVPSKGTTTWVIELRNSRSRVATLHLRAPHFIRAEGIDTWARLRDGETLARWLSVRGFCHPFDAWRSERGSILSPRGAHLVAFLASPRER